MCLVLRYRVSIEVDLDVVCFDGDRCEETQCIGALAVAVASGKLDGISWEPVIRWIELNVLVQTVFPGIPDAVRSAFKILRR